jgi:hypothetical protein
VGRRRPADDPLVRSERDRWIGRVDQLATGADGARREQGPRHGGGGFLGSHLVELLEADGHDVAVPRRGEVDLTDMTDTTRH